MTNEPQGVVWRFAGRELRLGPPPRAMPVVMGIVNATPDSFSDGGQYLAPDAAVAHALRLLGDGADIIDVGGESTRPGAQPVSTEVELERVLPVIMGIRRQSDVLVSIDTSKAEVARRCLDAGAQIINDVTALGGDPQMVELARRTNAGLIVMHMLGTPQTMQNAPAYKDVVREVHDFLGERLRQFEGRGIPRERVAIDPGIGFGKTTVHNLLLVRQLDQLADLGRPVCLGVSRKGFVDSVLGRPLGARVHGTVGATVAGYLRGAHIVRVHDVQPVRDAIAMLCAIERAPERT